MGLLRFLRALWRFITRPFRRRPSGEIYGSPPQPARVDDEDTGRITISEKDVEIRQVELDELLEHLKGLEMDMEMRTRRSLDDKLLERLRRQADLEIRRSIDDDDTDRTRILPLDVEAAIDRRIDATTGEPVTFTAFWPRKVALGTWTDLLVYISSPEARRAIFEDSARRLDLHQRDVAGHATGGRLRRGTEVTVIPELDDAEINPKSARVTWLESWQHVDFRFRLLGDDPAPRAGQVSFFVGPLLVGTLPLSIRPGEAMLNFTIASPYRSVFVSYAHEDGDIVDQLERAAMAVGDTFLRDISILRSGEEWSEAILGHIGEADVFQLCWSERAKQSPYVEQEWRHAHGLARRSFIRPMYWKKPMPDPPQELAAIHFRYVPFA